MFKLGNNKKIGEYLAELIAQKYPSKRQFCKAYLIAVYNPKTEEELKNITSDDEIRKMANRISQITKGAKAIQTYDLPIFTDLLSVSCEQILSAGEYSVPQAKRVTNYSIAFSKDPDEWESFINREDKLILNQDEYCKTIIDYALEFGNYDLLKYLMDKGYIWFDSKNDNDYIINFGAGTSIQRRDISFTDYGLEAKLFEEDKLRLNLIALAADHNDLKMLEALRAREIPEMYGHVSYFREITLDFNKSYNAKMIRYIAKSNEAVLDYFTDEIKIQSKMKHKDGTHIEHIFMFPFISELLDEIIATDSTFTKSAIKKATEHNNSTYKKLRELIVKLKNDEYYKQEYISEHFLEICKEDLKFSDNGNIVSFCGHYSVPATKDSPDGLITNIAHTTKTSKDPIIKHLIEELNESYDKIKNLKDHLEEL